MSASHAASITTPSQSDENTVLDLSGINVLDYSNPYDALIQLSEEDPVRIQSRYSAHRNARNVQQTGKLLDPSFPGLMVDDILLKLCTEPGYVDPRQNLCFRAEPTQKVRNLVRRIQDELMDAAPHLWLTSPSDLHLSVMEITHSRTSPEIDALVSLLAPSLPTITDYTYTHRARLVKPLLSYDAAAIALSYVPAAGEDRSTSVSSGDPLGTCASSPPPDGFTYHHLRRDIYALCVGCGVKPESRYIVPSSHLTLARFIRRADSNTEAKDSETVQSLLNAIGRINLWLQQEYWPKDSEAGQFCDIIDGSEWIVGEGQGLDLRMGNTWYGGGQSVRIGKGF